MGRFGENNQLGSAGLKQGSEQQCKQGSPCHAVQCSAAAMTGTFYTIHPTPPILHWTVLHQLWHFCKETNKRVVRKSQGESRSCLWRSPLEGCWGDGQVTSFCCLVNNERGFFRTKSTCWSTAPAPTVVSDYSTCSSRLLPHLLCHFQFSWSLPFSK